METAFLLDCLFGAFVAVVLIVGPIEIVYRSFGVSFIKDLFRTNPNRDSP